VRRARPGVLEPEIPGGPLDQFYVATRYPNSLPGGIPAQAFARPEAERAFEMAREVMAAVKRRLAPAD